MAELKPTAPPYPDILLENTVITDEIKYNVMSDEAVERCPPIPVSSETATSMQEKLRRLASMCMLGSISEFLIRHGGGIVARNVQSVISIVCGFVKEWKIDLQFTRPSEESVSPQEWGRVTSLYLQHLWNVIQVALIQHSDLWCPVQELLDLATETLSVGQGDTSVAVIDCIALLIDKAVTLYQVPDDQIVPLLDACWSVVEEARRSPSYWGLLRAFMKAVYQPCLFMAPTDSPVIQRLNQTTQSYWGLLQAFVKAVYQPCLVTAPTDSPVIQRLSQFAQELLGVGEEKSGVANVLVQQLTHAWSLPRCVDHVHTFTQLIVDISLFGNIQKRGDRQVFDVCASIERLGPDCSVNQLKDGISNQDVLVRATIVGYLSRLNPANTTHCRLATGVVRLLVDTYREMMRDRLNHFANSLCHRQRNRMMQTVLLLEPFVEQDYVDELWGFLWAAMEVEPQPSVRPLMEWTVMRLMARHTHLMDQIWTLFLKYRDTKNMVLCSLLCIVVHMGPDLPPNKQEDYYSRAIPSILPWCMAHHFNTRIFAQATLVKLWQQSDQLQLTAILRAHAVLRTIVDFSQVNRNSTKNVKKLLDSFYFKFLHFKRDYSLETLFLTLPSMTGLTDEDWIPVALFTQAARGWGDGRASCYIAQYNKSDALRNCDPGPWRWRGGLNSPEDENVDERPVTDGSGDVQKKIMPWKQMAPDDEARQEIDHGVKRHEEGGLVVVTSLISKVPNLGGLCRTSEIFGVSEYVLGKLNYTEDKAFQGLSVTAEKWLPITEVYETRLPEYLQQKRQEGYTLVGVEQTAHSTSLTDYTFPVKTLLLLGNEKEGIPVNLISLLDVCVEIPQQGVIRSLNVHVSGALLIWEYRRQQLVRNTVAMT